MRTRRDEGEVDGKSFFFFFLGPFSRGISSCECVVCSQSNDRGQRYSNSCRCHCLRLRERESLFKFRIITFYSFYLLFGNTHTHRMTTAGTKQKRKKKKFQLQFARVRVSTSIQLKEDAPYDMRIGLCPNSKLYLN